MAVQFLGHSPIPANLFRFPEEERDFERVANAKYKIHSWKRFNPFINWAHVIIQDIETQRVYHYIDKGDGAWIEQFAADVLAGMLGVINEAAYARWCTARRCSQSF